MFARSVTRSALQDSSAAYLANPPTSPTCLSLPRGGVVVKRGWEILKFMRTSWWALLGIVLLFFARPPARGGSDIVVNYNHAAAPVLPDMVSALRLGVRKSKDAGDCPTNELAFTFHSPGFPWSAEETGALAASAPGFLSCVQRAMWTALVRDHGEHPEGPSVAYPGSYNPSLNEITLPGTNWPEALCHPGPSRFSGRRLPAAPHVRRRSDAGGGDRGV